MNETATAGDQEAPVAAGVRRLQAIAWAGVLAVWVAAFSAADPMFLAPFRESQTAISADWLIREPAGGWLAYQTPVLGAPWRAPFELPLFQQATAWLAGTGLGVAQAGRVVSLLCWLGCLAALGRLLPMWGLPRRWVPPALAVVAAAPLHSAYSAAHLIESSALLAALLHLWAFWRFARGGGVLWWCAAAAAGAIAAMIKITTWVPAGALTGLLTASLLWESRRAATPWREWIRCGLLAVAGAGSLAAGLAWNHGADAVRSLNPLAEAMLSPKWQRAWLFGSWHDRLSPKLSAILAGKHLFLLFGPLGLAIPWVLWRGLFSRGRNPSFRPAILIPLAAYVIHVLIFFPLHLRHDYYLFGCGVFLSAAVAAALASCESDLRPGAWPSWAAPALALSLALGGVGHVLLRRGYRDLASDAALTAAKAVREPGALLIFGLDWSPRLPFEVGRKALMEPYETPYFRARTNLDAAVALNRSTLFAAALVAAPSWTDAASEIAAGLGLDPARRFPFWEGGFLLLRTNAEPAFPLGAALAPDLADLKRRVRPDETRSGLVFSRWPGSGKPGSGFECVVRRSEDAFWVRSSGLELIRVRNFFNGR